VIAGLPADRSQGVLAHTGEALDVALQGEGFLVVQTPDGLRYFRGGKNGKGRREKYGARRGNILNLFFFPASHFSFLTWYFSLFYGRKVVENEARGLVSRKTITSTRRLEA